MLIYFNSIWNAFSLTRAIFFVADNCNMKRNTKWKVARVIHCRIECFKSNTIISKSLTSSTPPSVDWYGCNLNVREASFSSFTPRSLVRSYNWKSVKLSLACSVHTITELHVHYRSVGLDHHLYSHCNLFVHSHLIPSRHLKCKNTFNVYAQHDEQIWKDYIDIMVWWDGVEHGTS